MLKIGEKIPNLDLITHKGEKINLHDFKGKKLFYSFIQELIHLDVLQKRVT